MSNGKGLDFARGVLEKYGWKEGQGLGRNENGLIKALKPALKFDCGGIGYNGTSEQFTSRWWEQSYNEVAKSICVTEKKGDVKVKQRNREDFSKKKDCRPISLCTSTDYNSFVKTSLLTGEGVLNVIESDSNEGAILEKDNGIIAPSGLTDEEIFQACGGRTVHKGARHGLRLSGKLSRIERQEELMLKFQKNDSRSRASDNQVSMVACNSHKGHGLSSDLEKGTSRKIHDVGNESAFSGEKQKKKKKKYSSFLLPECDQDLPTDLGRKRKEYECYETSSDVYTNPDSACSVLPLDLNFYLDKKLSKKKKKNPGDCEGENEKFINSKVTSELTEFHKKGKRKQDTDADKHKSKTLKKSYSSVSKTHSVH